MRLHHRPARSSLFEFAHVQSRTSIVAAAIASTSAGADNFGKALSISSVGRTDLFAMGDSDSNQNPTRPQQPPVVYERGESELEIVLDSSNLEYGIFEQG